MLLKLLCCFVELPILKNETQALLSIHKHEYIFAKFNELLKYEAYSSS